MQDARRTTNGKRFHLPGWLKSPFGARSSLVITLVAVLALVAGSVVVLQITNQMRHEADDRLAAAAGKASVAVQQLMTDASADIRLARQNVVFSTPSPTRLVRSCRPTRRPSSRQSPTWASAMRSTRSA